MAGSQYKPWRPSDNPGPPRFGLTQNQWRGLLELHAEVQDGKRTEWPLKYRTNRERFYRHLAITGRINEWKV
jgi:hypothetical protein